MDAFHYRRAGVWVLAAAGGLALVAAGWLLAWQFTKSPTVLPPTITHQVTGFTPQFYSDTVHSGYEYSPGGVVYARGILTVTLTKKDAPAITMTQQHVPADLSDDAIQQNAEAVATSIGKAAINTIEGRLLGSLIVRDRGTLILFNTSGDANKDDIRALLQNLRPAR